MIDFDPRDSSLFADGGHEALFSRLREGDSLSIDTTGAVPVYSLVRYDDVARAYKEPDVFSPSAGLTLDSFDPAQAEALEKMLETAPPERHQGLRSALQGAFRGASLAPLESGIGELLDRFLASAPGDEPVDFAEGLARGVASTTICELLGVTPAEAERLTPLLDLLGSFGADLPSDTSDERKRGEVWLLYELSRITRAHRREENPNGVIGRLLTAQVCGNPLSEHEVALNCLNVVLAGTGATLHTFAGAAAVWSEHPASLERVGARPALAPGLIEETLRWLTPVVHLTRIVTREVEVSGCAVPEGAGVCLWNISANRDEEVFEEAHLFRPERPPRRHLAFGTGPQHCLGAQVVRMQLNALLTWMLESAVRFELEGDPVWIRSNTITGVERLPVLVRRAGVS